MTRRRDSSFAAWMSEVDEECWRLAGISIHDLPDQSFRDAFESGENPAAFAREALDEEGLRVTAEPYSWSDEVTGLAMEEAAQRQFELDGGE